MQQMAATAPLAHRWQISPTSEKLHIPARLPQSVHPTSTSDSKEFRGCNRWQQPRLCPSLAISPTSEKLDSHTCTVAAICASHINFRFRGIPRMQQMAATAPLAHRCSSRRLLRSLIHIPARLPQSVHPTSTSDSEEFRGCNRWQQPRLWPIAVHFADFREASHTCTVAAICASHINFRFRGIPRMQQTAATAPLANRCSSRQLPRSLIHIPARLPQSVHPTSTSVSEEFRGCNRWQQPRLWPIAVHLADFREASHTCTVAAICASHINFRYR